MTIEQITASLIDLGNVKALEGSQERGDPEVAWGDWFYYTIDTNGESPKMPFATIVIKDYPGFDEASNLNRNGFFRLNIELGKKAFQKLFGYETSEFEHHTSNYDFTKPNTLFPHPVYAPYAWASIITPHNETEETVKQLLVSAHQRAMKRIAE